MAQYEIGDIVFTDENAQALMAVTNVNGERICCDGKEFEETEITLFSRSGITTSAVETSGKEICKVYWNVDTDSQRRMGTLYEYQGHSLVIYKGQVYCARHNGEEGYDIFAGDEILYAQTEDWIIKQAESESQD